MDKRKSIKGQTTIYKRYTSNLKSSNTNLITRDELIACAPYLNRLSWLIDWLIGNILTVKIEIVSTSWVSMVTLDCWCVQLLLIFNFLCFYIFSHFSFIVCFKFAFVIGNAFSFSTDLRVFTFLLYISILQKCWNTFYW